MFLYFSGNIHNSIGRENVGGKKMLDIKRIRENLEDIKKAMDRRGEQEFDLDAVVELDDQRRELLKEVEALKSEMNVEQKKIPQLMKEGKKEEAEAEKVKLKELSENIKVLDEKVKKVQDELQYQTFQMQTFHKVILMKIT